MTQRSAPDLLSPYRPRVYPHTATAAAFPLGGIGTGTVSLGARGELRDWQIFNRPARGLNAPFTFFALRVDDGTNVSARVLEADLVGPHTDAIGYETGRAAGLPRFAGSTLTAEYPFAEVEFSDDLPVRVSLEAHNPFVPLDADASGIPGLWLRYRLTNPTSRTLKVSVAGSLANLSTFTHREKTTWRNYHWTGRPENREWTEGGLTGLEFLPGAEPTGEALIGSLALATPNRYVSVKRSWLAAGWWDGLEDFWAEFRRDGRLSPESRYVAENPGAPGGTMPVGSVCVEETLSPGTAVTVAFVLTWSFPDRVASWDEDAPRTGPTVRNWYAHRFPTARAAALTLAQDGPRLEALSRAFRGALYGSTLPGAVVEVLGTTLATLRSPTCFRLASGQFLSYEGTFDDNGCCEGNCAHVWNYAQTLAFLFPELERSMRVLELEVETDEAGQMAFRSHQVFGAPKWDYHPAVDGQLGTVIRLYRDWALSGDEAFLARLWPKAAAALDFAFTRWDSDGDGVLDAEQHNTYDIEFRGPNSLANSMFAVALDAGERMARHQNDLARAERYRAARVHCARETDRLLWNGEYFAQDLPDVDRWKYQYGTGCLSDQVFGELCGRIAGLDGQLPADHVRSALAAVYKYNFFAGGLRSHEGRQRTHALGPERGLVLCTWPHGGRPRLPFIYADEVWSGVELQVASHLVYEGFLDEGLSVVQAILDRHDGVRRSPWDHIECGHHYVRSLAAWGLLLAYSGFQCHLPVGRVTVRPAVDGPFQCFFSTGTAWGTVERRFDPARGVWSLQTNVLFGTLNCEVTHG